MHSILPTSSSWNFSPSPENLCQRKNFAHFFLKEEDEGFRECDGPTLGAFLDGLVTSRRGRKEGAASASQEWMRNPTNNDVLKAIRIALQLRDDDIVAILRLADVEASKSEINALFRKKDQENFRLCGDQFLRNFLAGLTKKYRI